MNDFDFDTSDENSDVRQAWCCNCDGVVEADNNGCIPCRENGEHSPAESVVREPIAEGSPRNIECPVCDAETSKACHEGDDDSEGYNHAQRVEEWQAQIERTIERAPSRSARMAIISRGRR
jgi:hypothetical protein